MRFTDPKGYFFSSIAQKHPAPAPDVQPLSEASAQVTDLATLSKGKEKSRKATNSLVATRRPNAATALEEAM